MKLTTPKILLEFVGLPSSPNGSPSPFLFSPVDISSSELRTFSQCRGKWFLKYVVRLRSKSTRPAPLFGRIIHEILEMYYEGSTAPEDRTRNLLMLLVADVWGEYKRAGLKDQDSKLHKSLVQILSNYWSHWNQKDWILADTETNFRVPIFDESLAGFLHGRFDGVWIKPDNTVWIVDHKTTKRFTFKHLPIDPQMDHYSVAGSKLFGQRFGGVVLNYIRSRVSAKSPNFQRIAVRRNPHELTFLEHNLAAQLRTIGSLDPTTISFAFDKQCSWKCDFLPLCLGIRAGSPLKHMIERSYETRPREDDETPK